MSLDIDAQVDSDVAASHAAADQDRITAIQNGDKIGATAGDHMPVKDWMSNLPKNITVGVMDAARNTVDAANSFGAMLDNWKKQGDRSAREQGADQGGPPQPSAQDLRMAALERGSATDVTADHPFAGHASFRAAYQSLRDELASGSTTSDEVTQSISQFAIPMLGWTKLLGVQKAISLAGFGAEALTASTALDPHGGRNADLIATGKTVEGKLGAALSAISPDGSALNAYINYMTDRTNESEAEGRFKNVIDSLVTTASGASLIKTGATTIKAARGLPSYIAQNAGTGPVGAAAQEGKIVFHGTPHDFNEFDSSKIGTGEGAQVFGHGMYFAENPDVAHEYRANIVARDAPMSSENAFALRALQNADNDPQKAIDHLTNLVADETDPKLRAKFEQATEAIRNGTAKQPGAVMHVDIPDEHIANMLDHDKQMRDQPDVLAKLEEAAVGTKDSTGVSTLAPSPNAYGADHYKYLSEQLGSPEAASHYLSAAGVPGIKYLDAGSRSPVFVDSSGTKIHANGYAEQRALNMIESYGSVDKALKAGINRRWDTETAFYQDKEALAALQSFKEKGVARSYEGTRNIVLFDAKHAKIVKKE